MARTKTNIKRKNQEVWWNYLIVRKNLVFKLIKETCDRYGILDADYEDIYQELATLSPRIVAGKEHYKVKDNTRRILIKEIEYRQRIEKYLEDALEDEEGNVVSAYIDRITIETFISIEEDDTVKKVEQFVTLFGAEYRAVIKLLMLGYNQREIALRLKKGLDEIKNIIQNIQLVAAIYFAKNNGQE